MKNRSERIADRSRRTSRKDPSEWGDPSEAREDRKRKRTKGYYKTHACLEPFTCRNCGWPVSPEGAGSGHRNHCPNCLCSLHVDVMPGDRGASCHGIMDPVGVWVRSDGEWAILHRCRQCGKLDSNRTAADDNPMKLMALALKPFTSGKIGRERLGKMMKTMENHAVLK